MVGNPFALYQPNMVEANPLDFVASGMCRLRKTRQRGSCHLGWELSPVLMWSIIAQVLRLETCYYDTPLSFHETSSPPHKYNSVIAANLLMWHDINAHNTHMTLSVGVFTASLPRNTSKVGDYLVRDRRI